MLIWTDIQINNQSKKYFVLILKAHNIKQIRRHAFEVIKSHFLHFF